MSWRRAAWIAALLLALGVAAVGVWLATFDVNRYKPEIVSAVKQATGRELRLEGPLRLRLLPQLALHVKGAAFANASWGAQPEMIRVNEFAIRVALLPLLDGRLVVRRVELDGADVSLERNAEGQGNWQLELRHPAKAPEGGTGAERARPRRMVLPTPHLEELLVRDARVSYHDARTGRIAKLSLERLRVTTDDPSAPLDLGLDLAGAVDGVGFALAGRVGAFEKLTPAAGEPYPLDLTLRLGEALSAHVKGGLREPLLGRGISLLFQVDSGDLARVGRAFGREVPLTGPLELSGSVSDPEPRHYVVKDLAGRLAAGDVRGSVEVDLRGARPALALDLSSAAFDPAKLRPAAGEAPPADEEKAEGGKKKERRLIPATPLPFEALRRAPDTDLRWRVERLAAGRASFSKLDLSARLRDGELTLRPLSAGLAGGRLDAELGLAAAQQALSLRLEATGVELGSLLRQLGAGDSLERGPSDLSLELRGSGESLRAVAAAASGRLTLHARDATLDTRLLDRLGDAAAEVLRHLLGDESRVPLRCGVARFDLRGGLATSRVLLLDSPRVGLVGSGSVDLGRERPDLVLWARGRDALAEQAAVQIRVAGTLARPSFKPDKISTALSAAESFGSKQLRQRIGELAPLLGPQGAPRLLSCDEALAIASGRSAPEAPAVAEPTPEKRAQDELRRSIEGLLGR